MQNYRVTFGGEHVSYKVNFVDCREYIYVIERVFEVLESHGVEHKWWFFEPYVEITWLSDKDLLNEVVEVINAYGIHDIKRFTPKDGQFADWFGLTPEEREVSALRYSNLAELSRHYYKNENVVDDGLGLELHLVRNVHVLANQAGMDYQAEGIALLKRGILCLFFWYFSPQEAISLYEKLFNTKYMG